ncbi:MAG TPA: hypothetical protein VHB21_10895, partial [Minicystis sp.]|nr:hypothetical protein [Minicystis sp.]
VRRWTVAQADAAGGVRCVRLEAVLVPAGSRAVRLVVTAEPVETKGFFALDALDIAGSKYVDPPAGKVRNSQEIH